MVRAGLVGIRAGLAPPLFTGDPALLGDSERAALGLHRLPSSLEDALAALLADKVVTSWFDPVALETYTGMKRMELKLAGSDVGDAMCQRYAWIYWWSLIASAMKEVHRPMFSSANMHRVLFRRTMGVWVFWKQNWRHIAWDIGTENVALRLSEHLDAPLILANYSRLLIDLNRPPRSATSIPQISEATAIPGNINRPDEEVRHRIDNYFVPFQSRLGKLFDARQANGKPTIIIGVHSFTPVYKNAPRPWHAGILFRRSQSFGASLARALGGEAAMIAANEPYQIGDDSDYTVPVHGEARGLDAVLIELRQDLIADAEGAAEWAGRLSTALADKCFSRLGAIVPPAPSV